MALPPRVSVCTFLSTPSARRATRSGAAKLAARIFLSTPSARRATAGGPVYGAYYDNFYPRPPRGGRPCPVPSSLSMTMISIHALREEGDARSVQSIAVYIISIHALREEGDGRWTCVWCILR